MTQLAEIVSFKRGRTTVPWSEFAFLLNQAITATSTNQTKVMLMIGYSNGVASGWRKIDRVPLCAKYALQGLLVDLNVDRPIVKQFTFDELTGIFAGLNGWQVPDEARRQLIKKVAREIQND